MFVLLALLLSPSGAAPWVFEAQRAASTSTQLAGGGSTDELSLLQTSLTDAVSVPVPLQQETSTQGVFLNGAVSIGVRVPNMVQPTARSSTISVIGAGLGGAGAASFYCALRRLGFNPAPATLLLEKQVSIVSLKPHLSTTAMDLYKEPWMEWASKKDGFDDCNSQLLALGFNATTGALPTGVAYDELLKKHPQSKVVLNVHPDGAEGWAYSMFMPELSNAEGSPGERYRFWGGCFSGQQDYASRFVSCCNFSKNMSNTERLDMCMQEYDEHVQKVRNSVPKSQLLEFSERDGWTLLCQFLGIPEPKERFPSEPEDAQQCSQSGISRIHWEWSTGWRPSEDNLQSQFAPKDP